jgi:hypothetical protein
MNAQSKYKGGEIIEAREYSTGKWRPAVILKPAPYSHGKCDGAYIQWTDLPKHCPSHISTGGWIPENSIRLLPAELQLSPI